MATNYGTYNIGVNRLWEC